MVKLKFNKQFKYNGTMDPEVVSLCDAMNALPGIMTTDSCCGHDIKLDLFNI